MFKFIFIVTTVFGLFNSLLFAEGFSDGLKNSPKLHSLMFREATADYATWIIGEAWGKHIVVNKKAKEKKISIFFDKITCLNALRAICHSNGLWFQEDPESGIIYVETLEEYVKGNQLNNKKFIEVVTLVYPNVEDIAESLNELFHDQVYYTAPDEENGDASDQIERALDRLGKLAQLSTIIDDEFAGMEGAKKSSNDSNNDKAVDKEIETIRKESLKTEVGDGGEPVKLKPGVVFIAAVKSSNTLLLRSSDPESLKQVKMVIKKLDRPKSQVLLEVKVLSLDITDEKKRAFDMIFNSDHGNTNTGSAENMTNLPKVDGAGNQLLNQFGTLGVSDAGFDSRSFIFQEVSKNIEMRIELLDTEGKIERIATPNLMVTDQEASRIFVGIETTILTGVNVTANTTSGNNPVVTIAKDPITERRDIGTTLVITPKIHADKTVTIRIMQENARVGVTKTVIYGNVNQGEFFDTTDINKQTISSTVIAHSGELVALGGLITKRRTKDKTSIPIIKDIPIIGPLLDKRSDDIVDAELVVLIRPYVMLTPTAAERLSKAFIDRISSHPATMDGSLREDNTNPQKEKNINYRGRHFQEDIKVISTPMEL